MHWHGGEQSGAGRRGRPDTSPDVKGVFGEGASVVAVAPAAPQPSAARGAAALANLFQSELPPPARRFPRAESRGLWNSAPEPTSSTSQLRPAVLPRAVLGRTDALPRSVPPPPSAASAASLFSGDQPGFARPGSELRADATSAHTEAAREPVTVTHDFDDESTTLYQRDEAEAPREDITARPEANAGAPGQGDEVITARPSQGPEEATASEVITAPPESEPSAEPPPPPRTPARSGRPSARASRPSRGSSPLFAANQGPGAPESQSPGQPSASMRTAQRTFEALPNSLRAAGDAPAASANDNAVSLLDLERLAGAELAQAPSAAAPSPSAKPRPRARARAGQAPPPSAAARSLPQWARFAIALAAIAFGLITFSVGVSMGVLRLPPKPAPASPALAPPSAAVRPNPRELAPPSITAARSPSAPAAELGAEPGAPAPHADTAAPSAPASAVTPHADTAAPSAPADAVSPHADAVAPHADALAPHADALAPHADALAPHADAVTPHADALAPHADAVTPHADAVTPHAATPPPTAAPAAAAQPPAPSPRARAQQPAPPPPATSTSIEDPARVVAQAWAQLRAKNPAAAEALMRPLLARDPDDHHAAEALAQALLEQGKPKEALRYIEQIVRKRPKRAAYRILLGDARQALGDQDGAVAAWQAALKWEPDNAEAQRRLHLE